MKLHAKLVAGLVVLAMGLVPAIAGAVTYHPEYHPAHPTHPPTPNPPYPTTVPKGHAYGFYCKGFSKKHVKGQRGTPFSQCVQAMKVADHDAEVTARKACKPLSKKHVKGQRGTPFSQCVRGVVQMRRENAATVTTSVVA
jgi:uncharacterized membrane protein